MSCLSDPALLLPIDRDFVVGGFLWGGGGSGDEQYQVSFMYISQPRADGIDKVVVILF